MNFKYERLGKFCFVCGIVGHTERECNVLYAHPDKEVERAYGTWLRAQNRGGKQGVGSRWLRNADGGKKWAEDGGARRQGSEDGNTSEVARFKETQWVVRENMGDNFAVVVTARNQGTLDKERNNLNLNEDQDTVNTILETKRKRTVLDHSQLDHGPILMQTDGPTNKEENNLEEIHNPKNLYEAGSGVQTRRGL